MLPMIQASAYWTGQENVSITPILYNICLLGVKARDAEVFREYYPRLMERTERSPRSAYHEIHLLALALLPDFYLAMGEYREALAASAELERALEAADGLLSVPQRAYVAMLLLSIHFGLGDHARCIDYLNAIFAMKPEGLPPHRYGVARIYQLMIHFERGDDDLLEHLLRSAHRYFVAGRGGFKAEKVIITFIKRALRSGERNEWAGLFRGLLDDILPLLDDPFESSFLTWIDIVAWLASKVSGRPYAEIRRERAWGGEIGRG
jgi:tetratricopeptide (TPR) repeat protein